MKITLSYQPQHLIPPFAYAAVIIAKLEKGETYLELDIEYIGRDGISPEELSNEGFTENDNFHWEGTLNPNWKMDIKSFSHMEVSEVPDAETYLHIEVDGNKRGFPKKINEADVIFQELMQAVLEQAEIESPLHLICNVNGESYDLRWFFTSRSIDINGITSSRWDVGRILMQTIFSIDFESTTANQKPGKNTVMPGDGNWYQVKSKKIIEGMNKQIQELLS